jgi:hypothetical protein
MIVDLAALTKQNLCLTNSKPQKIQSNRSFLQLCYKNIRHPMIIGRQRFVTDLLVKWDESLIVHFIKFPSWWICAIMKWCADTTNNRKLIFCPRMRKMFYDCEMLSHLTNRSVTNLCLPIIIGCLMFL